MMTLEELLYTRIAEEAAEIAQAASKCIRFTPDHTHVAYGQSNIERLKTEFADLEGLVRLATKIGMFTMDTSVQEKRIRARVGKELQYLSVSQDMGVVGDLRKLNPCNACVNEHEDTTPAHITHCKKHAEKPITICKQFAEK